MLTEALRARGLRTHSSGAASGQQLLHPRTKAPPAWAGQRPSRSTPRAEQREKAPPAPTPRRSHPERLTCPAAPPSPSLPPLQPPPPRLSSARRPQPLPARGSRLPFAGQRWPRALPTTAVRAPGAATSVVLSNGLAAAAGSAVTAASRAALGRRRAAGGSLSPNSLGKRRRLRPAERLHLTRRLPRRPKGQQGGAGRAVTNGRRAPIGARPATRLRPQGIRLRTGGRDVASGRRIAAAELA